jgi:N-dimethylarginine dimethylaminohydrolase
MGSEIMPDPRAVLLCPPDYFDVVDVKNPFMEANAGGVDKELAETQWGALVEAFVEAGMEVETLTPTPDCEDMVFAANQTFAGRHRSGRLVCLLSHMRYESRRREVAAYATWFADHGYTVLDAVDAGAFFEGGGDALWHPGRHAIWAAAGPRTSLQAHQALANVFDAPVASVNLVDDRFYHLDTCLCAIDERTALWFPGAFDDEGRAMLAEGFENLIEVDEEEATRAFACNAAAFPSGTVVIDQRAERTRAKLADYRVIAVDTGEFLKSGGSVFCLKQFVY